MLIQKSEEKLGFCFVLRVCEAWIMFLFVDLLGSSRHSG